MAAVTALRSTRSRASIGEFKTLANATTMFAMATILKATVALATDGTAYAWGRSCCNRELPGGTFDSAVPVFMFSGARAVAVSRGRRETGRRQRAVVAGRRSLRSSFGSENVSVSVAAVNSSACG